MDSPRIQPFIKNVRSFFLKIQVKLRVPFREEGLRSSQTHLLTKNRFTFKLEGNTQQSGEKTYKFQNLTYVSCDLERVCLPFYHPIFLLDKK